MLKQIRKEIAPIDLIIVITTAVILAAAVIA